MKIIKALLAVPLLVGVLGLSGGPVMAYEVRYIRLTGMLFPVEQEGRKGMHHTLDVRINGKVWILQLAKVENLGASSESGRVIFRQVFPARVSFTGAEDLLHNLQNPEIVAQPVTITGYLYPVSRVFFVTALG
ncbi:MAG: hypothetical protein HY695_26990 [Deltaproteobacteria bacterium]|nr:hypothetical protein [Deltaproteobacteria bacterium]